jgi:hypothetical protein
MSIPRTDRLSWTRRNFVQAGLITSGAAGMLPAFAGGDPVSNLDDLAHSIRGRLLRGGSAGYDEARKVWNLAYDRRPLAMVRAANVDDVRRCLEFARKHSVPIAIRGGGHSYAGYGVADGALQIDLGAMNSVTRRPPGMSGSSGANLRTQNLRNPDRAQRISLPPVSTQSKGASGERRESRTLRGG